MVTQRLPDCTARSRGSAPTCASVLHENNYAGAGHGQERICYLHSRQLFYCNYIASPQDGGLAADLLRSVTAADVPPVLDPPCAAVGHPAASASERLRRS